MSFWGSACSLVDSIVSSACSLVGGLVASLSPAGWIGVCVAVFGLCKALGMFDKEKDVEELGDKVIQAEEQGIRPGNFKSYDEYLKKLEEFEVDPERSKQISKEDKLKAGAEVMAGSLMERFGEMAITVLLKKMGKHPDIFTSERMMALGKMALNDKNAIANFKDYLTSKDDNIIDSTMKTAMDLQRMMDPGINPVQAQIEVMRQRAKCME